MKTRNLVMTTTALLLFSATGWATPCPVDEGFDQPISDNVNPNIGCELGSTNNDTLGGDPTMYGVNLDMMFGFDDWIFAEKAFEAEQDVDIGLSVVGDTISGDWSIDDIWTSLGISSLMLVFKDGSAEPNVYVGYLIAPGATMGDYLTPFLNTTSGGATDISHISAYYRTGGMSMPEPGTLALFGVGLLAGVRLIRRKN